MRNQREAIRNKKQTSLIMLLGLLRPYLPSVLGNAVIGSLTILANTGLLAISAILICMAALMPPVMDLMPMSAGVRLCGISRAIFRYWERLASHSVTFKLLEDLRVWYYRQLLPLTPGGILNKHARLMKSIMEDLETLQFFYLRVVATPLVALITLLSISGILAFFLPSAIPVLWIAAVLNGLILPILSRRGSMKKAPLTLEKELSYRHRLQDLIFGMETLWVYGRSSAQKKDVLFHFLKGNDLRQDSEAKRGYLNILSGICSGLAMAVTLWLGAIAVESGALAGIHLLAVGLLVNGALESVQPLPLAVSYYYESLSAMDNMLEIAEGTPLGLEEKGEASETTKCEEVITPPSIDFSQVSFTYPEDDRYALKEVSFHLPSGSKTAVIGIIGSGKSSIVRLLMGYYKPQTGRISINGLPLSHYGKEAVCSQISYVEQSPYLFTASLRENLQLPALQKPTDDQIWEALDWAGLGETARSLPRQLDTLLSFDGQNFSAGERQRLALARMYLENKPIIILDEALKNLDNITADLLRTRILAFCSQRTLIMISHNENHPAYMDYVLSVQDGQAVLKEKKQ